MFDSQTWRGKVARYRKWEARASNAVGADAKRENSRAMARFYIDLSNDARAMVEYHRSGARIRETESADLLMDERSKIVWTKDGLKYKIKIKEEEPNRHWFQRFEHEPWFELGYWNHTTQKYQDTDPAKESFADIIARNRAIDIQHSINNLGMKHPGMFPGAGATAPSYHTPDHIHMDIMPEMAPSIRKLADKWKDIDPMLSSTNPDDLESAAAHAMAEAARIRAIDAREPSGEEPTISWQHPGRFDPDTLLTYVAFKAGNGRWYETAHKDVQRGGKAWRELVSQPHAEALRTGTFLVVTEWSTAGGE